MTDDVSPAARRKGKWEMLYVRWEMLYGECEMSDVRCQMLYGGCQMLYGGWEMLKAKAKGVFPLSLRLYIIYNVYILQG